MKITLWDKAGLNRLKEYVPPEELGDLPDAIVWGQRIFLSRHGRAENRHYVEVGSFAILEDSGAGTIYTAFPAAAHRDVDFLWVEEGVG